MTYIFPAGSRIADPADDLGLDFVLHAYKRRQARRHQLCPRNSGKTGHYPHNGRPCGTDQDLAGVQPKDPEVYQVVGFCQS